MRGPLIYILLILAIVAIASSFGNWQSTDSKDLTYTEFLDKISNGEQALNNILQSISYLIGEERKILSIASQSGDEVTVSMMSDYLKEQEKLVWMLTAYNSK